MKLGILTAVISIFTASVAVSGTAFGTEADARKMATYLSEIIVVDGVDAGIDAMNDPDMPFASSAMGLQIFEGSMIVADNRAPDLEVTSFADVADLTWTPMWPRIVEAAHTGEDATLQWYHYDTETEYTFHCYSEWAQGNSVLVMACR